MTPSVQSIIPALTAHPQSLRAHKLLYWVCRQRWENSVEALQQTPMATLLEELMRWAPTLEHFEKLLIQGALELNKPERYQRIGMLIVHVCAPLYATSTAPAQPLGLEDDLLSGLTVPGQLPEAISGPVETAHKVDRFQLRQALMQNTPALKIKILLFSSLRRPFQFEPPDWDELRLASLDEWVAEFLESHPSMADVETLLHAKAQELSCLDQAAQVAEAIIQALQLHGFAQPVTP